MVTPIAPIFSEYEVVPFPEPQNPARIQPTPSIKIPLLMACVGGGGASDEIKKKYISFFSSQNILITTLYF